jgi:outer membrane protein TolC
LTNAQNDIVKANDAVASNLTSLQQMIKQKHALHLQSEGQEQAYKSLQEAYECKIFGMVDVINERTQEILALDTATYKLG